MNGYKDSELENVFDGKYIFQGLLYSNPNVTNVYLAQSIEDNEKYAIKEVLNYGQQDLKREIDSLKKINKIPHINLISLIEEKRYKNRHYLVFEYMEEGSLLDFINKKKIVSEEVCLDIFRQFVSGYIHLLKLNIFHRDIKCGNILLTRKPGKLTIKIGDFGFSTEIKNHSQLFNSVVGTYKSKQVIEGKYTLKSDVFSFGLILCILLDGNTKIYEKKDQESINQYLIGLFKRTAISKPFQNLIERMLTINEDERIGWDEIVLMDLLKQNTKYILHSIEFDDYSSKTFNFIESITLNEIKQIVFENNKYTENIAILEEDIIDEELSYKELKDNVTLEKLGFTSEITNLYAVPRGYFLPPPYVPVPYKNSMLNDLNTKISKNQIIYESTSPHEAYILTFSYLREVYEEIKIGEKINNLRLAWLKWLENLYNVYVDHVNSVLSDIFEYEKFCKDNKSHILKDIYKRINGNTDGSQVLVSNHNHALYRYVKEYEINFKDIGKIRDELSGLVSELSDKLNEINSLKSKYVKFDSHDLLEYSKELTFESNKNPIHVNKYRELSVKIYQVRKDFEQHINEQIHNIREQSNKIYDYQLCLKARLTCNDCKELLTKVKNNLSKLYSIKKCIREEERRIQWGEKFYKKLKELKSYYNDLLYKEDIRKDMYDLKKDVMSDDIITIFKMLHEDEMDVTFDFSNFPVEDQESRINSDETSEYVSQVSKYLTELSDLREKLEIH